MLSLINGAAITREQLFCCCSGVSRWAGIPLPWSLTLSVNIGTDGTVHGVRVLKSLGLGQDEKGIGAVKQRKLQPAYQDGKPIP